MLWREAKHWADISSVYKLSVLLDADKQSLENNRAEYCLLFVVEQWKAAALFCFIISLRESAIVTTTASRTLVIAASSYCRGKKEKRALSVILEGCVIG